MELTCARSDDFSESQKMLDGFETRILTTNRRFPAVDGDKLDAKLSACVPATVESFECLHRVVSIFILDINVPAKMRLVVAANFELRHAADSLKFRNNVLVKFSANENTNQFSAITHIFKLRNKQRGSIQRETRYEISS